MLTKSALPFLLWLVLSALTQAQSSFRYYVFDRIKTDTLDYELVHDVSVRIADGYKADLDFYTEYRIAGSAEKQFTYTVQQCSLPISFWRFHRLRETLRALPLDRLEKKPGQGTWGWVEFYDKNLSIATPLREPQRAKLHALIMQFVDEVAPRRKRKFTTRTIGGDFVPARVVALAELIRKPKRYDGKRVTLEGFYHAEFEQSALYVSKSAYERDAFKNSIWLGGSSTFANPRAINLKNDSYVTVTGTFIAGSGGHMGLWPGELVRTTHISPVKR